MATIGKPLSSRCVMAEIARRNDSGTGTHPASQPSVSIGDQLQHSQSTEGLLNDLFQELLPQREQLRKSSSGGGGLEGRGVGKGERKMTSGEMGSRLEAEITGAREGYAHLVLELGGVERHLLQAKARVLAEEERALAERSQASHGYGDVGIPTGPSQLSKYLSVELLEKHHLLHPSHYTLPPSHAHLAFHHTEQLQPPKEPAPSYLQPTFTSTQHCSTSEPAHPHTSPVPPAQRPPWKDMPTPAEREADRQALARLKERGDYLCNPRYSTRAQPNTASLGAQRMRERVGRGREEATGGGGREKRKDVLPPLDSGVSSKCPQLFVAEPKEVLFTDYQVGEAYQANIDIRNVSGASRQMRIVPLNSPYFTIRRGQTLNPEGLIAPGMHVSYAVTFTPDSLGNYHEEMKVMSHCGLCLSVPLKAVRPAPQLTLPENIDCGCCLAGGEEVVVLQCENKGGEGRFRLCGTDSQGGSQRGEPEPQQLMLGAFSLSPAEFHLLPGDLMQLQVTFTPLAEGTYEEQFGMTCDNGQTLTFSLSGAAEKLSVGCVFTGDSSLHEVTHFTSTDPTHQSREADPVLNSINYDHYQQLLEDNSVTFEPINPQNPVYKTVVIRNFSNVELPFSWGLYRPLTELQSQLPNSKLNGESPVISDLVKSTQTPFSITPTFGSLPAQSAQPFLCQFLPRNSGHYCDAAHLLLHNVPSAALELSSEGEEWRRVGQDSVSCVCLFLHGTAEPYLLELQPPALLWPASIPIATETRRRVKLVSHSLSIVHYQWRQSEEGEGITITPRAGSIVPGRGAYCEVVINRSIEGSFSLVLVCDVQHSPQPITLPLQGWIEGPIVSVDHASLAFGLVSLGSSSSLPLRLGNHSNCSLTVELRQSVRERGRESVGKSVEKKEETEEKEEEGEGGEREDDESRIIMDHACLHFTPPTLPLSPHTVTTVTVECRPLLAGRLRSIVQCVVDGKVHRCLSVQAEVQRPAVSLRQCRTHEKTAFVGVSVERRVEMVNASLIPTQFTWSSQPLGSSASHCSVSISPMTGCIGPRETVPVSVTATWDSVGTHPEAVLQCDVVGMREPLLLVLSAEVHGLAVNYSVKERSSSGGDLYLDYGDGNSLSTPHTLHLLVTNPTAIPAHLTTHIRHFPPSPTPPSPPPPPPPPPGPTAPLVATSSRGKMLLSRTTNIGDPNSKTLQQATKDHLSALLREGRGCCFVVDPPSTPLHPFTTHTLTITAYSDMWGEYHDELVCEVPGLEPVVVPVRCSVSGCPLVFHGTATTGHTLVRFGSHPPDAPPIQRVVRVNNTSPEDIRVDWKTFNLLQEDSTLLDLITIIGDPFPCHTPTPTRAQVTLTHTRPQGAPTPTRPQPTRAQATPTHTRAQATPTPTRPQERSTASGGVQEGSGDGVVRSDSGMEPGPLIRVMLRAHEGVEGDQPFNVQPTQMVVPARGHSSLTITFHPTVQSMLSMGANLSAHCLGYLSLDRKPPPHTHRPTAYDIPPLRIDITATIQPPRLQIEADSDKGLHFSYPASILIQGDQVLDQVSKVHHLTLVNTTSSTLQFTLSCTSPHFTLTPSHPTSLSPHSNAEDLTSLPPQTSIRVMVSFHLSREELRGCREQTISYSDQLKVQFSTGVVQEFPLTATIVAPSLTVPQEQLELGNCLLGSTTTSSLSISNASNSGLFWEAQPSDDLQCALHLAPCSGWLPPHLTDGRLSSDLVHIVFSPVAECDYTGSLVWREVLTGREVYTPVVGSGASDEGHRTGLT